MKAYFNKFDPGTELIRQDDGSHNHPYYNK